MKFFQTHVILLALAIFQAELVHFAAAGAVITAGGLGPVCGACIVGACLNATTPCLSGCLLSWVGYPICASACIAIFCVPCIPVCACHDILTKVHLPDGTETHMSNLKVGDAVMTYDRTKQAMTTTRVLHLNVVENAGDSIEVTTSDKHIVIVTPGHHVYRRMRTDEA